MKVLALIARFLVTNLFFLVLAVSLHEFGHSVFAYILGCDAKAIIFDTHSTFPYSQVYCERNDLLISLGGLLVTLPLPFLFSWITKEEFRIAGLGLIFFLSSSDISLILNIYQEYLALVFFGISFVGEIKLMNHSVSYFAKSTHLK